MPRKSRRIELSGKTFGDWRVVRFSHKNQSRTVYWICVCKCGVERAVRTQHLNSGASAGCGCSANARLAKNKTSHGLSRTREYTSWQMMKSRCDNPNYTDYRNYGGRGITYCDGWARFENFVSDMGNRPDGMSLDRIDPNGNYSPENCRWATSVTQNRNTRRARFLEYDGQRMRVSDWAKHIGISQQGLQWRLKNWPLEKALTG